MSLNSVTSRRLRAALFVCVLLAAAGLRLPHLAQRPLHTDEAVHAVKFGLLLEKGDYRYDPYEYHGPALVYLTLIPAALRQQSTFAELDEITLRIVPLFFGLALTAIPLAFRRLLPKGAAFWAALLTAVSPAMVFYSRYYIMEMLLVFFTACFLLALWKFLTQGGILWGAALGLSMGLMHASKETFILSWAAAAAAVAFLAVGKQTKFSCAKLEVKAILVAFAAALLVSGLFFSSFGKNPRGIIDSVMTYAVYFSRGAGHGSAHVYPWYAYFKWLGWNYTHGKPFWSEAAILLLGLVGCAAAWRPNAEESKAFQRFLCLYTLILTALYSLIPYKTPWSMLSFLHGWILLASAGIADLLKRAPKKLLQHLYLLFALASLHLGLQAFQQNRQYDTDSSNPYVYAHTHRDLFRLVQAVEQLSAASPLGKDEYIEIICPNDDYWPLPWYLRRFRRVGYFSAVNFDLPAARLIIAKPEVENDLLKKLYELPPPGQQYLYLPFFAHPLWLRDGVEIGLYVRKDLWDQWYYSDQREGSDMAGDSR
ncbi:MAG: TIGR03663 family protein [candidate division KSB1 bacterium]|nr:TIGR03663 family protein [candidate division KSB1 bacterium]